MYIYIYIYIFGICKFGSQELDYFKVEPSLSL